LLLSLPGSDDRSTAQIEPVDRFPSDLKRKYFFEWFRWFQQNFFRGRYCCCFKTKAAVQIMVERVELML